MDHLSDDYGIEEIQVEYVARDHAITHPPCTKEEFHKFPKQLGWKLQLDYRLETHGNGDLPPQSLDTLLTEWLFFGLIRVVLQENETPILEIDQLHSGTGWLSTASLKQALKKWADWEKRNPQDLWARMIQVEYVLEKARQVVRRNCGYDIENDHVEYHTDLNEVANYVSDEKAMALMALGECLWQVKARIMEDSGHGDQGRSALLHGWHGDDEDGWGPPRWVFKKMLADLWCPRAIFLLKGQLRSNATLLLQAYYAYKGNKRMVDLHEKCTRNECLAKALNSSSDYAPQCLDRCEQQKQAGGCRMVGPDMDAVRRVLEGDDSLHVSDIPVLRFSNEDEGDPVELTVEALPKNKKNRSFATISHVWSDGWGNETENKLHTCQLKFIRRQLRRLNDGKDIDFWMDTLLVPVKENMTEEEKSTKKKAIGQIFQVFNQSKYTVVLDNGLHTMNASRDKPTQTAMTILASSWMRRLWTLQEAFLSRQLHFAFGERRMDWHNLISYDSLDEDLGGLIEKELKAPLTSTVKDMLTQNIMSQDDLGDSQTSVSPEKASFWIASVWSAARWRTTSNHAHETLALATLLGLKYQGTQIEEAGLTKLKDVNDKLRDQLVTEFWKTFHNTHRGAIPPGMIFLPGAKVEGHQGFGWAPRTWLSAHEIDYPNPLNHWTGKTDLLSTGLEVKYPGFLLHTMGKDTRSHILGMDQGTNTRHFTFPANRYLLEWYSAKPVDEPAPSFLPGIASKKTALAIIISRPRPVESPPEIGLLVEIWREEDDRQELPRKIYSCKIIRRIHIWRDMNPLYLAGPDRNGPQGSISGRSGDNAASPHWKIIGGTLAGSSFCLGESVPADQRWVVDGYITRRPRPSATSNPIGTQRTQAAVSSEPPASNPNEGGSSQTAQAGTAAAGAKPSRWSWITGTGRRRQKAVESVSDRGEGQVEPSSPRRMVTFPARPPESTGTRVDEPVPGILPRPYTRS